MGCGAVTFLASLNPAGPVTGPAAGLACTEAVGLTNTSIKEGSVKAAVDQRVQEIKDNPVQTAVEVGAGFIPIPGLGGAAKEGVKQTAKVLAKEGVKIGVDTAVGESVEQVSSFVGGKAQNFADERDTSTAVAGKPTTPVAGKSSSWW